MINWKSERILVTGCASFIGAALTRARNRRGADVQIVGNLTTGKRVNVQDCIEQGEIEFVEADLQDLATARSSMQGIDVVFHFAVDHGGRGCVGLHQAATSVCSRRKDEQRY